MKSQVVLELTDVKRALAAAEQEAMRHGWAVSIAVCDAGGVPLGMLRMDTAPLMSALLAPDKARTCAMTGKSSLVYEQMINQGRVSALSLPVFPMEGGVPVLVDGAVVGGVGVSGVKSDEDAQVAAVAVAAILQGIGV